MRLWRQVYWPMRLCARGFYKESLRKQMEKKETEKMEKDREKKKDTAVQDSSRENHTQKVFTEEAKEKKRRKTVTEYLQDQSRRGRDDRRHHRWSSPKIMVPGFLGLILVGALLLMLPVCNADGHWLDFTDALFTSCTCVCVTGLVTVVPAVQFTFLGKLIMMCLIQIGGWGVIVCIMSFLVLLRRRITLNSRVIIRDYFNMDTMSGIVRMLNYVVRGSLLVEGIGALGYSLYFVPHYGFLRGCWYSVFHAVSAFCNAGVDILGETSLQQFTSNGWMNLVTMALIVTGGLGFMVWQDLQQFARHVFREKQGIGRAARRLQLQTKVVLVMTTLLLAVGTVAVFFAERTNPATLGSLGTGEKWMAALFQSVTVRTAGFYTIAQDGLREVTKFICGILMFIGGSPVGTAGGAKTVTVAVLALTCWSILKGHQDTECFHRRIADRIVRMAVVVVAVQLMLVLAGSIALCALEPHISLMDALYEVVSAVATVGLTAGQTPGLSLPARYVIMALMYLGRIGPITLPMMIASRLSKMNDRRTLPEEHIVVG